MSYLQMQNKNNHIKTGFTTPDNFFENFEENLSKELNLNPITGFSVPDDYFNNVTKQIIDQNTKPKSVISLFAHKYKMYASSIAAAVIIGVFFLLPKKQNVNFDDVSDTAFIAYADEAFNSTYDLITYTDFDNETLSELSEIPLDENLLLDYLSEDENLEIDYNNL